MTIPWKPYAGRDASKELDALAFVLQGVSAGKMVLVVTPTGSKTGEQYLKERGVSI